MEPLDHLVALVRNWIIIAVLTVLGLGGGWLAGSTATPTYRAVSSVVLAPSSVVQNSELGQISSFMNSQVHSYAELANSRVVLGAVVDELELPISADRLAAQVDADVPINTLVIEIGVVDADPDQAARLANSIAGHLREAVEKVAPHASTDAPAIELKSVGEATTPEQPTAPNKQLYLAAGAGLGLFLGVLIALARHSVALARQDDGRRTGGRNAAQEPAEVRA